MPLLFAYGTLQQADVQFATFGRLLRGERDGLVGFDLSIGRHANVTFTGCNDSRVDGMVFDVTDAELAAADRYEQRAGYTRVRATLASGREAWVYVEAPAPR